VNGFVLRHARIQDLVLGSPTRIEARARQLAAQRNHARSGTTKTSPPQTSWLV